MSQSRASNRELCLPEEYEARAAKGTLPPISNERPPQDSTYGFAAHLMRHGGCRYLIDIGLSNPQLVTQYVTDAQIIGVGPRCDFQSASNAVFDAEIVAADLQEEFVLPDHLVKNAVVVCHGVLETLNNPWPLLRSLEKLTKTAAYVLITAKDRERSSGVSHMGPPLRPHVVREWTLGEFKRLASRAGIAVPYTGYVSDAQSPFAKDTGLLLSGTHTVHKHCPSVRVCAIIACRNDVDIIQSCFEHLKNQGVDVCFIDDWSDDGTWEALQAIRMKHPESCVHIERLGHNGPTNHFDIRSILRRKSELAQTLNHDWFIHQDVDEIRSSPTSNSTLVEAIAHVDALGYNAIDHTVLEFRPTHDHFDASKPLAQQFSFFQFSKPPRVIKQVKTFKRQTAEIDLESSGGHDASFPNRRIYPLNFQISHYPYRSPEQARTKIFKKMLPRAAKERDALGWHTHFEHDAVLPDYPNYVWPRVVLQAYNPNRFNTEFLVERLSRIDLT